MSPAEEGVENISVATKWSGAKPEEPTMGAEAVVRIASGESV